MPTAVYSNAPIRSIQLRKSRRPIIIASRASMLAKRQAEFIGEALGRLNPHVAVQYKWIESDADRMGEASLSESGGKALFVSAIELAVLSGKADIAVHSLKDMPTDKTAGLMIAAIPQRGDARDCLVTRGGKRSIDELSSGAIIGTSSPRRAAQLSRLRQDLKVQPLRGNVETRLRQVIDEGRFDATLLAVAGLHRVGLHAQTAQPIDPSVILPAAGQGALAVQCRSADHVTTRRCLPINEPVASAAVNAERDVVAGLRGDCHSSLAVLAEPVGERGVEGFRLRVRVLSRDGSQCLDHDERITVKEISKATKRIVNELVAKGARAVLKSVPVVAEVSATGHLNSIGLRS